MWTIYGLLTGELDWSEDAADVVYACTTCGNCTENCRFEKFQDFLVDFIEAARGELVEKGFCPEKQKHLLERIKDPEFCNPYGENNSDNEELKKLHDLPDKAEWVYFIGCTSNYRQKNLRDATIKFLKSAGIDFTLIDEHCCCSPVIRTGQVSVVNDSMNYNITQILNANASKVITSCSGCYRTLKKDWVKFGAEYGFEIFHTTEIINKLLNEGRLIFKSEYNKIVTYHDPCHLGRHMDFYEIPRQIIEKIPGINLVEMERNKGNAWCCGAGGGVKIGFPEWSVEVSKERLEEAKTTGASIITSACPFCRTNLSDANEKYNMGFEIYDLIEIIDNLDYKINKTTD